MKKVELEIIAISHSITQTHSYAVVLGEVNGMRRLPIVIGGPEAQSIAVAIEKIKPKRPLTHDLLKSVCDVFSIDLKEIVINKLEDGIFHAQLVCIKDKSIYKIDSRTSDALALAARFNCPIYTYETILESSGIMMEEIKEQENPESQPTSKRKGDKTEENKFGDLSKYSLKDLEKMLDKVLENEEYERAIKIRDELNRRKKDS